MSYFVLLEKRAPKNPDGSIIMVVQNGPVRQLDPERKRNFTNKLIIRASKRLDLKDINPGDPIFIDYVPQGISSTRPGSEEEILSVELVAHRVSPLAPWQAGEDNYPIVE